MVIVEITKFGQSWFVRKNCLLPMSSFRPQLVAFLPSFNWYPFYPLIMVWSLFVRILQWCIVMNGNKYKKCNREENIYIYVVQ